MGQQEIAELPDDGAGFVDELPAGTQLLQGQYTITRFLNNGGFGITYLAKDSLDRDIVIKECFPNAFCRRSNALVAARSRAHQAELRSVVKLFVSEARNLSKLVHPNIVGVHQVFEDNDTAYMAIDYIKGRDLLDIIEDPAVTLSPDQIVGIAKKTLSAVEFIHENNILHRDISPDNILLNDDDEPILIDFGAAREKASNASRALTALRVVKDGYSPQEFYIVGSDQGPWSDLYALAASLFHLITGEAPVNGQVRLAALAEDGNDPYNALSGRIPGYPHGFLEAIDKAMNALPRNRLQTAQEWMAMLSAPKPVPTPVRVLKVVDGDPEEAISKLIEEETKAVEEEKPQADPEESKEATIPAAFQEIFVEEEAPKSGALRKLLLAGTALAALAGGGYAVYVYQGKGAPEVRNSVSLTTPAPILSQPLAEVSSTEAPVIEAAGEATEAVAATTTEMPATFETSPSPFSNTPIVADAPPITVATEEALKAIAAGIDATNEVAAESVVSGQVEIDFAASAPASVETSATVSVETSEGTAEASTATAAEGVEAAETETPAPVEQAEPEPAEAEEVIASLDETATDAEPAPTPEAVTPAAVTEEPAAEVIALVEPAAEEIVANVPAVVEEPARALPAQAQVAFAHWDVRMPFRSRLRNVDGAIASVITQVGRETDRSVSGNWIERGTSIYEVNGNALNSNTPLASLILNDLKVDPDGYTRTTVLYRSSGSNEVQFGLLATPTVRTVGLANGLQFEVMTKDGKWQSIVTETGTDGFGNLRKGDILFRDKTTGQPINGANTLDRVLQRLVRQNATETEFSVIRNRGIVNATMLLAVDDAVGE